MPKAFFDLGFFDGEPSSGSGGTAGPDHGGTAGPGDRNEFLFREVRTPSGKPGWGMTRWRAVQSARCEFHKISRS